MQDMGYLRFYLAPKIVSTRGGGEEGALGTQADGGDQRGPACAAAGEWRCRRARQGGAPCWLLGAAGHIPTPLQLSAVTVRTARTPSHPRSHPPTFPLTHPPTHPHRSAQEDEEMEGGDDAE